MKEFTITIREEHLLIIRNALFEASYKTAAPVLQALQEQINAQVNTAPNNVVHLDHPTDASA